MDEYSSDDEDLRQKAFVIDNMFVDETDENDHLPPTSGHDYLRRVIKEAKKEPAIVVANISNYNFKNAYKVPLFLKNHIDETPAIFIPSIKWQSLQEAEFSKIRQKLVNLKAQFSNHLKEDNLQLPPINNFNAWLKFCLGEAALIAYQIQPKPWCDGSSSNSSDSETINVNKSLKSGSSEDSIRSNVGDSDNFETKMDSVLSCENLSQIGHNGVNDSCGVYSDIDFKINTFVKDNYTKQSDKEIFNGHIPSCSNYNILDQNNFCDKEIDITEMFKSEEILSSDKFNNFSSSKNNNIQSHILDNTVASTYKDEQPMDVCLQINNESDSTLRLDKLLNKDKEYAVRYDCAKIQHLESLKILNKKNKITTNTSVLEQEKKCLTDRNSPTLDIICRMNQPTIVKVLNYFLEWMNKIFFNQFQGQWIYALLACLEKPLEPETCSILRSLVLFLKNIRCKLKDINDENLGPINLLICIIARYFGQLDLADQPTTDNKLIIK